MFHRFEEFVNFRADIEEYLKEVSDIEKVEFSDKDGPCKGKPFDKIGSDGHLLAMQHHSSKFNAIKKGKGHSSSEHVAKTGLDYHTRMYHLHKKALNKK